MNSGAIILGIAGSFVAVAAVSKRSSSSARAPERAAPSPALRALPADTDSGIPQHTVDVVPEAPASALPATSSPVVQAGRSPKDAARELLSYVSPLIRSGQLDALGSKDAPNTIVQALQRDMKGKLVADGVYGPKTAARGKELLGLEFPQRVAPKRIVPKQPPPSAATPAPPIVDFAQSAAAPPSAAPTPTPAPGASLTPPAPPPALDTHVAEHSPKEAAEALYLYVTGPSPDFGAKGHPSDIIKQAQLHMGKLTADGIYGPKTEARGKALTGKKFPPRR